MTKFPYERVMAWLAGPIAILAGWGGTLLIKYVPLGFGNDETAKAIVYAVTFAVGAGLTWATHQKWFTGLWKWWEHIGFASPPVEPPVVVTEGPVVPLEEPPPGGLS